MVWLNFLRQHSAGARRREEPSNNLIRDQRTYADGGEFLPYMSNHPPPLAHLSVTPPPSPPPLSLSLRLCAKQKHTNTHTHTHLTRASFTALKRGVMCQESAEHVRWTCEGVWVCRLWCYEVKTPIVTGQLENHQNHWFCWIHSNSSSKTSDPTSSSAAAVTHQVLYPTCVSVTLPLNRLCCTRVVHLWVISWWVLASCVHSCSLTFIQEGSRRHPVGFNTEYWGERNGIT